MEIFKGGNLLVVSNLGFVAEVELSGAVFNVGKGKKNGGEAEGMNEEVAAFELVDEELE